MTNHVTSNVTINWPDTEPSLSDLVAIRKELQKHLHDVTIAIDYTVHDKHPEFLKIDWNKLNNTQG